MEEKNGKLPEVTGKLPEVTGKLPEVTGKLPEVTGKLPEVFDVCLVCPSHQVVSDLLIVSLIDVRCRHSHNLRPLRRVLKSNLSLHR